MGDRLAFMEGQLGTDNEQVIGLKKYYSLLQIKDYMLASELAEKCQKKSVVVVYFYTNKDCPDCTKQGYVLTALREKYPELRVYSFDADLDLSAIKTLQTVTGVSSQMPTLVINGKAYAGFQSIEDIEKNPQIKKLADAQKAADQYKTSE
jgi:glutaredoxin